MVNVRLIWILEKKGLRTPAQCGFRQMRSCTENSICEAFISKNHHVSVFFDLEKAYDTTWRYGILKTLHDYEFRGELPLFIQAFLKNQRFRVKVGLKLETHFHLFTAEKKEFHRKVSLV
ncbi:uncharacterized protein LOC135213275 [Macrobrachium nipponense]|uniref:uncharacterized protein LOC135213275 n=1 Tax=Macrobrachium nipponense TaxID=159736 RepID=UPI0030C824EF